MPWPIIDRIGISTPNSAIDGIVMMIGGEIEHGVGRALALRDRDADRHAGEDRERRPRR